MNKKYRYLRGIVAVIVGVLSVLAFMGLFYPVQIFDVQLTALLQRALVDFSLFTGILLAGLLVVTFLFGRIYCSTLCPLGLYQEFLMLLFHRKVPVQKNKPYKYFLAAITFGALVGGTAYLIRLIDSYTLFGSAAGGAWLGMSVLVALAVKGGIELGKTVASKIKKVIVPAGAGSAEEFANRCLNCNLCVQNCPMKILKKANGDYPAVHIDYEDSFCDYNCNKCSQICPSGAIKRLTLAEKQKTQIGLAVINEQTCVKCGLCVMKCPREAITKEDGQIPLIDANKCIGCGACANGCPVKAISIVPVEKQKIL